MIIQIADTDTENWS